MKRVVIIAFLISFSVIPINKTFAALISQPYKQDKRAGDNNIRDNKAMKIFLDKIEIYGKVAKPQTVFIIPGSDPRVDGIRIERRFFSDIFRNVEISTLKKQKIKTQRNIDHILW